MADLQTAAIRLKESIREKEVTLTLASIQTVLSALKLFRLASWVPRSFYVSSGRRNPAKIIDLQEKCWSACFGHSWYHQTHELLFEFRAVFLFSPLSLNFFPCAFSMSLAVLCSIFSVKRKKKKLWHCDSIYILWHFSSWLGVLSSTSSSFPALCTQTVNSSGQRQSVDRCSLSAGSVLQQCDV